MPMLGQNEYAVLHQCAPCGAVIFPYQNPVGPRN